MNFGDYNDSEGDVHDDVDCFGDGGACDVDIDFDVHADDGD